MSYIKQDRQCMYNVTIRARSCCHCCNGKGISVTYSECVFVSVGIQHAMLVHRIILSSVACPGLCHIFPRLINGTIFGGKKY
jgi:hypothetical protein